MAVGLRIEQGEPRLLVSAFLKTHEDGDRLSLEPYRVAAEMAAGARGVTADGVKAAVAEGRRQQDRLATEALQRLLDGLADAERKRVVAGLLVNRAGWITDLLSYSLAFADHVPVAEGLAVRDAFRFAFVRCGMEAVELDEKSLPATAPAILDRSKAEIDATLKALGAEAGKPWRKEQKLACLAAWMAAAGPNSELR
ncbi:MAG: hypothetical protein JF628_16145 [Sphingomonas sp.]|nr:hypothetical protein [Sphingomonas sp.]